VPSHLPSIDWILFSLSTLIYWVLVYWDLIRVMYFRWPVIGNGVLNSSIHHCLCPWSSKCSIKKLFFYSVRRLSRSCTQNPATLGYRWYRSARPDQDARSQASEDRDTL
jgi:hypothetical protein